MKFQYVVLILAAAGSSSYGSDVDDYLGLLDQVENGVDNFIFNTNFVEVLSGLQNETILFHLYTKSNPATSQQIYPYDDDILNKSHFNASKPTRIYVHDWLGTSTTFGAIPIRDAYIKAGDYNVIVVDWSAYFDLRIEPGLYVSSVGRYIGSFLDYLDARGNSLDNMVVVGHGLGAYVAGQATSTAITKVGCLVALDPVVIEFDATTIERTILPTDATFVQVIRTADGISGFDEAFGDADYFPNGGSSQPGCEPDLRSVCSHLRAYELFARSINHPRSLIALKCVSYSDYQEGICKRNARGIMGGDELDAISLGTYYMNTEENTKNAGDAKEPKS